MEYAAETSRLGTVVGVISDQHDVPDRLFGSGEYLCSGAAYSQEFRLQQNHHGGYLQRLCVGLRRCFRSPVAGWATGSARETCWRRMLTYWSVMTALTAKAVGVGVVYGPSLPVLV